MVFRYPLLFRTLVLWGRGIDPSWNLIVLGPKKLPELARSLGRGLAELRRTAEDLQRSILTEEAPLPRPRKDAPNSTPSAPPIPSPVLCTTQACPPANDPAKVGSGEGSPGSSTLGDADHH
ncbi:MAG: hypothetical protein HGB21_15605 [Nitrospirae bacterium]|nr:hypothetical protein [Nitrospirota bacterium]